MQQTIRTATPRDAQRVLTLMRRSGLASLRRELEELPHSIQPADALNGGTVLVVAEGDEVLGASWARNRFSGLGRLSERVWCWETLAVRDEHRSSGLGALLAEATVAAAVAAGVELLYGVCADHVVGFHERVGMIVAPRGQSLLVVSETTELVAPMTADGTNQFVYRLLAGDSTVHVSVVASDRAQMRRLWGAPVERR